MNYLLGILKLAGFIFASLLVVKTFVTINYYIDKHNHIQWEEPGLWIFRPWGKVKYFVDIYRHGGPF